MKTSLPLSIDTVEQAKKLLTDLHTNNEHFHPEDDACDIPSLNATKQEAELLNKLMKDIYDLPENNVANASEMQFDPCAFILDLDRTKITSDDIIVGAQFETEDGIIWCIDKLFVFGITPIVETSMQDGAQGNYRNELHDVVFFLNEKKAIKL